DGAPVAGEGASAPEADARHVGHGDAHAQVVPVVLGADLGDGGPAEGAHRVQVGAGGEHRFDVRAVVVPGDDRAVHRQCRRGVGGGGRRGHEATTVVGGAHGTPISENRATRSAL